MKISKLKYVFAFMLVLVVATTGSTVKAAKFNDRQLSMSKILESIQAVIEDGDDSDAPTAFENEVYLFTTGYRTAQTALGAAKNPVYSYAIKNTRTSSYIKAYSLVYGNVASNNREEVTFSGVGQGSETDNRIGLALAFSKAGLTSAQAGDQTNVSDALKNASYATQMYIWLAQSGLLNSGSETAVVNANLTTQGALDEYYALRMSVNQALLNPSYTYATQSEANAHPLEMMWNASAGRYEYTVDDTNGLDVVNGINLLVNGNSGIEYSKNGTKITFYATEQVGSASNPVCIPIYKSVKNGRYVPGYATTSSGESLTYLTDRQNNDTVTYVSLYTNALRVKVQKSLGTNPQNSKTGDAKLAGAVYGVYEDSACTKKVEEIVTDASGVAISNPLELKDYWVKEITTSEGTKIDTASKKAEVAKAKVEANGQRVVTVNSTDNVIYGGFRMIVSVSDLSGSTTKDPAVGSKIKLTLKSNANEYYETTVDAQGYADFTNIPYGYYTCTEIEKVRPDLDFMDPIDIYIDREETYIYSKIINTEVAQRYIQIFKVDEETGKLIPASNTEFRVTDKTGKIITQKTMYPVEQTLTTYTTDPRGWLVMPEKLPYGEYNIYEVNAPEGYYNKSLTESVVAGTFKVETNSPEDYGRDERVEVRIQNLAQKVNLKVKATGQVLTGTSDKDGGSGRTIKRPVFGGAGIPGVVYTVTAKEDIITGDGTVRMKAGDTVTLTTDASGNASTQLYLGSYTVEETSVPKGYVLESGAQDLELEYKGQRIKEYDVNKAYTIVKQGYEVNLTKEFEDLLFYRQNPDDPDSDDEFVSFADVVVGIYTAEEIVGVTGTKIPANTLVDVVTMNNNGTAVVNSELPMGNYYAKELETNENYEVSTQNYNFSAVPTNYTDKTFTIDVDTIVNKAKRVTKFTLVKIEEVTPTAEISTFAKIMNAFEEVAEGMLNGFASINGDEVDATSLEGAEYEVLYLGSNGNYYPLLEKVDGELVPVVRTTDENGEITLEGLPFGKYAVRELTAPRYYDLDSRKFGFEVSTGKPEAELILQDVRTKVDVAVTVVDEDGTKLADATVELIDPDTNEVAYTATTDEEGVALFEQIRAGRYIRKVSTLAEYYVVPEDAELYAEDPEEPTKVEVEVKFIKGNIVVYKTDAETGEPVPGCKFSITNELGDVVAEGESDEAGYFKAENLRYGVYYVEETEAAENYEKDDTIFEVIVDEDGATYEVDFTNVPTGDIAVVAYVVLALVSLAVIVRTVKKMKMN